MNLNDKILTCVTKFIFYHIHGFKCLFTLKYSISINFHSYLQFKLNFKVNLNITSPDFIWAQ